MSEAIVNLMVVDDDPESVKLVKTYLGLEQNLLITTHHDPLSAEAAFNPEVDGLLTDFNLPHMNGEELADRLKERKPQLLVYTMSAGFSQEKISRLEEKGYHPIRKPLPKEVLDNMVTDIRRIKVQVA